MNDRKIIQLIYRDGSSLLVALCDDGSVWVYDLFCLKTGQWVSLPELPTRRTR